MRSLVPGHRYELDHLDGSGRTILQFVSRRPLHEPVEGVTNQEVLRALVDRVQVLDAEVPWPGNAEILVHLRMALALHEARALLRHVQRGEIRPELLPVGTDGHLLHGAPDTPARPPGPTIRDAPVTLPGAADTRTPHLELSPAEARFLDGLRVGFRAYVSPSDYVVAVGLNDRGAIRMWTDSAGCPLADVTQLGLDALEARRVSGAGVSGTPRVAEPDDRGMM